MLSARVEKVLKTAYCCSSALDFRTPVLSAFPEIADEYLEIVESPEDLGTLCLYYYQNLKSLSDEDLLSHLDDIKIRIQRIFSNAILYNVSSRSFIVSLALHMDMFMGTLWEEVLGMPYRDSNVSSLSFDELKITRRVHRFDSIGNCQLNVDEFQTTLDYFLEDLSPMMKKAISINNSSFSSVLNELCKIRMGGTNVAQNALCLSLKGIFAPILSSLVVLVDNIEEDLFIDVSVAQYGCLSLVNSETMKPFRCHSSNICILDSIEDFLSFQSIGIYERTTRGYTGSSIFAHYVDIVWAKVLEKGRSVWWTAGLLGGQRLPLSIVQKSATPSIIENYPRTMDVTDTMNGTLEESNSATSENHALSFLVSMNLSRLPSDITSLLLKLKGKTNLQTTLPTDYVLSALPRQESREKEVIPLPEPSGTTSISLPPMYYLVEFFDSHDFGWVREDAILPFASLNSTLSVSFQSPSPRGCDASAIAEAHEAWKWKKQMSFCHKSNDSITRTYGQILTQLQTEAQTFDLKQMPSVLELRQLLEAPSVYSTMSSSSLDSSMGTNSSREAKSTVKEEKSTMEWTQMISPSSSSPMKSMNSSSSSSSSSSTFNVSKIPFPTSLTQAPLSYQKRAIYRSRQLSQWLHNHKPIYREHLKYELHSMPMNEVKSDLHPPGISTPKRVNIKEDHSADSSIPSASKISTTPTKKKTPLKSTSANKAATLGTGTSSGSSNSEDINTDTASYAAAFRISSGRVSSHVAGDGLLHCRKVNYQSSLFHVPFSRAKRKELLMKELECIKLKIEKLEETTSNSNEDDLEVYEGEQETEDGEGSSSSDNSDVDDSDNDLNNDPLDDEERESLGDQQSMHQKPVAYGKNQKNSLGKATDPIKAVKSHDRNHHSLMDDEKDEIENDMDTTEDRYEDDNDDSEADNDGKDESNDNSHSLNSLKRSSSQKRSFTSDSLASLPHRKKSNHLNDSYDSDDFLDSDRHHSEPKDRILPAPLTISSNFRGNKLMGLPGKVGLIAQLEKQRSKKF